MQREYYDADRIDVSDPVRERHRNVAADVVSEEEYGLLIGGERRSSASGETMAAVDATTGETLARFQNGTPEDVERAVTAAREAFDGQWGNKSPQQRAALLNEVADELEERKTELARLDSLEVGKANQHSLFVDTTIMVEQFRHFAALARTTDEGRLPPMGDDKVGYTLEEPYGVVGQISAWNFPAMFVAWKVAPALAAGNTVVYKPSSRAVLSTLEAVRTIDSVLPPGTINVVTGPGGDVGDAIAGHDAVRKVALTGSTGAGRRVMENAAQTIKPVALELGGKSPNVVFPDADLDKAVEGTLIGIFYNQGEQCTAGSRLFLHEDVYDEFLAEFVDAIDGLTVGDPLAPTTDIGPLVDHDHLRDVQSYIETAVEEGAKIAYGGEAPTDSDLDGAPFVEPTVLTDVEDDDTVACEEIFGPVLSVFEWSDPERLVRRVNDTEFGLAAGVWTTDLETAHQMASAIEAGTVWINTYNDLFEPAPYGGYKQSGIGRELAVEALDGYRQVKSVKLNFDQLPKLG
ncbi:aldehyde dehydrogenase [halophilic archaeon]|nr:aldehyde dehydrogenase [halophilic archaeon]